MNQDMAKLMVNLLVAIHDFEKPGSMNYWSPNFLRATCRFRSIPIDYLAETGSGHEMFR
jgi:hypothetical protein